MVYVLYGKGGENVLSQCGAVRPGPVKKPVFLNGSHQEKGFSHLTVHSVHP